MHVKAVIKPNTYSDSMSLMAPSTKVNQLPEVHQAMIGMGTGLNKQVIAEVGLSTPEVEAATPRDQIIVVQCDTEEICDEVLAKVEELRAEGMAKPAGATSYRTSRQAYENATDTSLAIITVPGEYAADEARAALDAGRHVLMFSDNVSVEDEISLKQQGHDAGLLVMGPDCGTAIINGVGLCFANVVADGPVGIVGASGTGSQELSVQIDALGSGVSQLIGTGGRDLSEAVGGIMMLDGLRMLAEDPATTVIALLSKPPAASVAERVLSAAGEVGKPVVVCFIGADAPTNLPENVTFVANTLDAARAAVEFATGSAPAQPAPVELPKLTFAEGQTDIRGLFCGGTVCDEVFQAIAIAEPERTRSNVAKRAEQQIEGETKGNLLIDFGADEYTQGRPHPMIDPTLRSAEIVRHAADPATAVLLIDVELGYGSNPDPAGAAAPAIAEAFATARAEGRELAIIAYVLGTDRDPQDKAAQTATLTQLGVTVVDSAIGLADAALRTIG